MVELVGEPDALLLLARSGSLKRRLSTINAAAASWLEAAVSQRSARAWSSSGRWLIEDQ